MPGPRLGPAALTGLLALTVAVRALRRRLTVVAVIGPSMWPTLAPGDRVLVRRARAGAVRPDQIVVIEKPGDDGRWAAKPPRWPADGREWIIKRVAATAGDRCPDAVLAALAPVTGPLVPPGHIVILGDNTARSLDSRQLGYVPADRVLGIVSRRVGPARSPGLRNPRLPSVA